MPEKIPFEYFPWLESKSGSTLFRQPKMLIALVTALALGGCATYHPKPLSTNIVLPKRITQLIGAEPGWHETGNTTPLSVQQLTLLALYNNPKLKASRLKHKVAGAQLYAAGLLPDPSLSFSMDKPTGDSSGLVNAWGLGLEYDLLGMIKHQAKRDIQSSATMQVSLELAWQEWQVVQKARALAATFIAEFKQLALLKKASALYQQRYAKSAKGLAEGDITLDVNGSDLTAFIDNSSQVNQLEQTHNDTRHALNQLLGLSPEIVLNLQALPEMKLLDATRIKAQLASLPQRRPDLMALKAGYSSQEAKVHSAILSQFPSLLIGFNRARDTGGLYTSGLSISLNLPFFSRNRGEIAVERATREQMKAEFEARLIQTAIDIDKLASLQTIIARQQKLLDQYFPQLNKLVEHARKAYQQGDIDALVFLNLETTWLNKKLEKISLEQLQRENHIALQTALAIANLKPFNSPQEAVRE